MRQSSGRTVVEIEIKQRAGVLLQSKPVLCPKQSAPPIFIGDGVVVLTTSSRAPRFYFGRVVSHREGEVPDRAARIRASATTLVLARWGGYITGHVDLVVSETLRPPRSRRRAAFLLGRRPFVAAACFGAGAARCAQTLGNPRI